MMANDLEAPEINFFVSRNAGFSFSDSDLLLRRIDAVQIWEQQTTAPVIFDDDAAFFCTEILKLLNDGE